MKFNNKNRYNFSKAPSSAIWGEVGSPGNGERLQMKRDRENEIAFGHYLIEETCRNEVPTESRPAAESGRSTQASIIIGFAATAPESE